jgi:pimeloyl-ACP methyl ester carboxylesterase
MAAEGGAETNGKRRRNGWGARLRRLAVLLAVFYAGIGLFAWFLSDRLIFVPHPARYADSAAVLKIPTADGGSIAALHLVNPAAHYTLLYSHGNAEDLYDGQWLMEDLRRQGFAVLAYDYRGYGVSGGGPATTAKACLDAEAAYDYLVKTLRVPPERIILYGRSVGTGFAVHLASRRPAAGLVLESPFVSAFRVMTHWPLFPFDKLPNLRDIRRVKCPVLVMHGTADRVIPCWHGRAVYAAAPEPKRCLWVEGAGHNDMQAVAAERINAELRAFAASLPAGR